MKKILLTLIPIIALSFNVYSQCTTVISTQNDTANCNGDVAILLQGYSGIVIDETFNCNLLCNSWQATSSAQTNAAPCGNIPPSQDGSDYIWMGDLANVPRALITGAIDLSGSDSICFELIYAQQGGCANAEGPDESDEGVTLQYSIDFGLTWIDIAYYMPDGQVLPSNPGTGYLPFGPVGPPSPLTVWNEICVGIPTAAMVTGAQLQWIQEVSSSIANDHWGLDNIQINQTDPNFHFFNGASDLGTAPVTHTVTITSDTALYYNYINITNGELCQDTIDLYLHPTDAGEDITISCSTLGSQLQVNGVDSSSIVIWTPALGLNNQNIHNPYANPINDQMYIVTSDCGSDSTFVNVVPIFEPYANTSNDSICVNDSSLLLATSDQPMNGYTYEWTNFVPNNSIATTPVFPTINTTYYLEMVSDSGCVRNDSVVIYVGAIPKTINYLGDLRTCRGDSTQITVEAIQPTFFDDFDNGANFSIWADIQNGTANTDCGSVSGDALHFNGIGDRHAQLIPLNVLVSGGTVSFDLIYGGFSAPGTSCNFVSFLDNVEFQYSLTGLPGSFVTLTTYNPADFVWTSITEVIPAAAAGPTTVFRVVQPTHSGNNTDNWAIDNFLVELDCTGVGCVNYTYDWTPTTTVSDPTSLNPFFFPAVTTTYSLSISPEGFSCNSAADVIIIEVDELTINTTPTDTFLCEPATILLDAEIQGFANSCDGVYSVTPVSANILTGTATTVSLGDDAMSGSIPIPFDFEFFCEAKTSFAISSNGFLSFSSTDNGCCAGENLPTPDTFNPDDVIALMWSDLNPTNGGIISHFVTGSAPNRVQVIEFASVPHYGSSGATVSGQIQLFETSNIVEVHCIDCQSDNGVITMGIENSTGTMGYTPPGYNAADWSAVNEGWKFIPSNSQVNFNILWSPNTDISAIDNTDPLVSPQVTTDYVIEVLNINNCAFYDTATVNIYESNTTITANPNPVCEGIDIQLNATGADSFIWTPATDLSNANISNPISSTTSEITYYVEYNTGGCIENDSISIEILPSPTADINNGTNPVEFCEGTTTTLSINNLTGWTYAWTGPETGSGNSLDITTPGLYTVIYNDGSCANTSSVNVLANSLPTFDFSSLDTILCCTDDSTIIEFSAVINNGVTIQDVYWNGLLANNSSEIIYSNSNGNSITNELNILRVITDKGCIANAELPYISTRCANPVITGADTVYSKTTELFDLLSGETNATTTNYTWSTNDVLSSTPINDVTAEDAEVNGDGYGLYYLDVTVTNSYDGKDYPCIEIASTKNYEVIKLEDPEYPDAFTPKNGDQVNNLFLPVVSNFATIKEFRVYNRWGQLVYDIATADNKEGWDGTWNGVDQEAALYLYFMNISHPDKDFITEGNVTLLR